MQSTVTNVRVCAAGYVARMASWDDVREIALAPEPVIVVGDHLGLDDATRARVEPCTPISIGPVSVHAEDAIAVMCNELDRRGA